MRAPPGKISVKIVAQTHLMMTMTMLKYEKRIFKTRKNLTTKKCTSKASSSVLELSMFNKTNTSITSSPSCSEEPGEMSLRGQMRSRRLGIDFAPLSLSLKESFINGKCLNHFGAYDQRDRSSAGFMV